MLLVSHRAPARGPAASGGAPLSSSSSRSKCCCSLSSSSSSSKPPKFIQAKSSLLFSKRRFISTNSNSNSNLNLTVVKAAESSSSSSGASDSSTQPTSSTPPPGDSSTAFVGQDDSVPLEGVIQIQRPNSNARSIQKWGRIALLSGGDVLALLLFAAIGRFSHGFPVWDTDTLRTADPFIAGWFLSAYFLGGYGVDGRGINGLSKAVVAAAKSWALGIPLGIAIRAASSGHIPQLNFLLVSMGSTGFLLLGWRALLYTVFPNDETKKSDVYRRGNP